LNHSTAGRRVLQQTGPADVRRSPRAARVEERVSQAVPYDIGKGRGQAGKDVRTCGGRTRAQSRKELVGTIVPERRDTTAMFAPSTARNDLVLAFRASIVGRVSGGGRHRTFRCVGGCATAIPVRRGGRRTGQLKRCEKVDWGADSNRSQTRPGADMMALRIDSIVPISGGDAPSAGPAGWRSL